MGEKIQEGAGFKEGVLECLQAGENGNQSGE